MLPSRGWSSMPDRTWFRIGHTTHSAEKSGCTVVVFDQMIPAAVDVRGGAPGTRETTLLDSGRIGMLDAIVLSGGSAFGLRAADGVMQYLAEHDRGVVTRAGNVPLVSSTIIYDLTAGTPYYPTAQDGYQAAASASTDAWETGPVGAGAGATVAKLGGSPATSGVGIAIVTGAEYSVTAVIVLNAVGDVRDPETNEWLAIASYRPGRELALAVESDGREHENTTIGAVLVSANLDQRTLKRCCISAHAALARCTVPAHTFLDGDTFFAACSGTGSPSAAQALAITCATEVAVENAICSIFRSSSTQTR